MVVFPGCKINLGLNIVEKRPDGFHNIETVFCGLKWRDVLEVLPSTSPTDIEIETSGLIIDASKKEDNIIYKAYNLLAGSHKLPPIKVFLHKTIPMGAGLGGGSSDAAFFMKLMNEKFSLNISKSQLLSLARQLGSDCAFFMENTPVFATQKGDVFEPIQLNIDKYHILTVYPGINSNTTEAYEGVVPQKPKRSIKDIILNEPIENWKNVLTNDFEKSIFKKYGEVEKLKQDLYDKGAIYASMSGSGSAVFGVFKEKPELNFPINYLWYFQEAD